MSNKPFANRGTDARELRDQLREKLFKKQQGLCHICGKLMTLQRKRGTKIPSDFATFDHLNPRSNGGTAYYTNLKLAHRRCNNARGSKPLHSVVQQ